MIDAAELLQEVRPAMTGTPRLVFRGMFSDEPPETKEDELTRETREEWEWFKPKFEAWMRAFNP